jgi:hypothetical protein
VPQVAQQPVVEVWFVALDHDMRMVSVPGRGGWRPRRHPAGDAPVGSPASGPRSLARHGHRVEGGSREPWRSLA